MSVPPNDPPLPPLPPGRWPQFSEVRGPGRKLALAFLLLVSVTGFLGMALNILVDANSLTRAMEVTAPPSPRGSSFAAQAALDGGVMICCLGLLRSRRRSWSWRSLACLFGMAFVSCALYLWLLLKLGMVPGYEIIHGIIAVFKIGSPLLVMGSLLGSQWLPLTDGMRKRERDGKPHGTEE